MPEAESDAPQLIAIGGIGPPDMTAPVDQRIPRPAKHIGRQKLPPLVRHRLLQRRVKPGVIDQAHGKTPLNPRVCRFKALQPGFVASQNQHAAQVDRQAQNVVGAAVDIFHRGQ